MSLLNTAYTPPQTSIIRLPQQQRQLDRTFTYTLKMYYEQYGIRLSRIGIVLGLEYKYDVVLHA